MIVTGSASIPTYAEQQADIMSCGFDTAEGIYWENLGGTFIGDFTHNMEWVTESAINFINDAAASSTPFFLYFNPSVPHDPAVSDALNTGDCLKTPEGTLSSEPQVKHMTVDATSGAVQSCSDYRASVLSRQDSGQSSSNEQR